MAKSNSGQRSTGSRERKQAQPPEDADRGLLRPVVDAVRAHPVATAAAVAAGGVALARMARRSGGVTADRAAKGGKAARKSGGGAAKSAKKTRGSSGGRGGAPRGGLAAKVTPDERLGAVVGGGALTRAEVTKRVWDYIKQKGLQDSANRRMINADERLRPIFGKDQVSMFEMTRLVNQHLRSGD